MSLTATEEERTIVNEWYLARVPAEVLPVNWPEKNGELTRVLASIFFLFGCKEVAFAEAHSAVRSGRGQHDAARIFRFFQETDVESRKFELFLVTSRIISRGRYPSDPLFCIDAYALQLSLFFFLITILPLSVFYNLK
jgi:hypothetical protein